MKSALNKFLAGVLCGALSSALAAETVIETSNLRLAFSDQGWLLQAVICYPRCDAASGSETRLQAPQGIIAFDHSAAGNWVQRRGLDGAVHQLYFTGPDGQWVHWKIPQQGYLIEAQTAKVGKLSLNAGPEFRPRPAAGFGGWLEQVRYVAVGDAGTRQFALDGDAERAYGDWVGFRSRYWAVLASADEEMEFALGTGPGNRTATLTGRVEVPAGTAPEETPHTLVFYLGPVEPRELAAVDEILPDILYAGLWPWLRSICFALYYLLGWVQSVVPVWGLAIMVLSLLVHVLMLPLSRVAEHFQQQVNATEARLAPELARIKRSFRGEEQAAKIIALYKTEHVHPLYSLKSLLGVALVIPVFIGAFDMLAENIHLLDTPFLWIDDLSHPDALFQVPFSLPFFGQDFNLLPWLMTGLSLLASALHRPAALDPASRARQVRNMVLLALAFFVLFYTFPAGMVLYWTSNNLLSVGKSAWARGKPGGRAHPEGWLT